jgi:hypothetical protein
VRNTTPAPLSTARIVDNELEVGHLQTGLLLVNVDRSWVTDNLLRAGSRPADAALLQDAGYRGALRRQIFSNPTPGGDPPPLTNTTVTFNGQTLHFRTDLGLIRSSRNDTEWQRAINALDPPGISSPRLLERFLKRLASDLIRTRGTGRAGSAAFANVVSGMLSQDTPTAEQGIVVGGELASEIRLTGNTVLGAMQGIHIGVSVHKDARQAGVVSIERNTVQVGLPTSATRERHGIFVGSADSILVERNYVGISRVGRNANLRVEGIRLFGLMGRRVIARHNHMGRQFAVGITFAPLNAQLPDQPLWIVTENEMEAAPTKVDVPGRAPRRPGVANPALVRQRIRGLGDNFA